MKGIWDNVRVLWLCWREARRRKRNGARLEPRPPGEPRPWDWPEDTWPSIGGWADRERL